MMPSGISNGCRLDDSFRGKIVLDARKHVWKSGQIKISNHITLGMLEPDKLAAVCHL